MKFPLPVGHRFGVNPHSDKVHAEGHGLWLWQRQFAFSEHGFIPSKVFDGPTQSAVIKVQHRFGLTVTGELDEDTWNVLFKAPQGPAEPLAALPKGVAWGEGFGT